MKKTDAVDLALKWYFEADGVAGIPRLLLSLDLAREHAPAIAGDIRAKIAGIKEGHNREAKRQKRTDIIPSGLKAGEA